MDVRNEIEVHKPELQALCRSLGVLDLRMYKTSDSWADITFVGDLDTSRVLGYADRFFSLEEGLLEIFQRRVDLIDREAYDMLLSRSSLSYDSSSTLELLHGS